MGASRDRARSRNADVPVRVLDSPLEELQGAGRRDLAIRQYEMLRARFADELGITPSPITQSLVRSLRS